MNWVSSYAVLFFAEGRGSDTGDCNTNRRILSVHTLEHEERKREKCGHFLLRVCVDHVCEVQSAMTVILSPFSSQ